jgi:DNA-binding response OmpR family regulator
VEVCRRVKSQRPSQPIVICSAAILDVHVCALRDMQVDQFLSKPYHPLELLNRIAIELARSARAAAIETDRPIRPWFRRDDAPTGPVSSSHPLVKAPMLD